MSHTNLKFGFIFIFFISLVSAKLTEETEKNCKLFDENGKEISDLWAYGFQLKTIEDTTKPGTIIAKYKSENIYHIVDVSDPADEYIKINVDKNFLIFKLRDKFAQYEDRETSTEMKIRVHFTCSNFKSKEAEFRLKIIDTNNHAPEFLDAPYNFTLPLPIPKNFDFDQLGKIAARDVDLTNERVTFVVKSDDESSEGFLIKSNGKDKKTYPAKLTASGTLDFDDHVMLMVFATDSGNPPLTSNTTINITVDKENSAPRFSHALYTADLTNVTQDKLKEKKVTFSQGIITLERGYDDVLSFEISGVPEEHKKHFKITYNGILRKHSIEVDLTLVDLTEELLSQKVLSLILKANKKNIKAETALNIVLPDVNKNHQPTEVSASSEEKTMPENESSSGYMIATIILSLTTVGLLGSTIYLFINRRD